VFAMLAFAFAFGLAIENWEDEKKEEDKERELHLKNLIYFCIISFLFFFRLFFKDKRKQDLDKIRFYF
jgi:hypothetical protein